MAEENVTAKWWIEGPAGTITPADETAELTLTYDIEDKTLMVEGVREDHVLAIPIGSIVRAYADTL